MQSIKGTSSAAQIGRLFAAIPFLSVILLHADEASVGDIATSGDDKAAKAPTLVEVVHKPKHDHAEQINMAKNEARRIYEILMKDEMPELRVAEKNTTHHVNGLELTGREGDRRSVVFRYDRDYRLVRIYIGLSDANADSPLRAEVKLSPSETFEKVFGHPPTGKIVERSIKSVDGDINGGTVYWKTNWPEELEYEGSHPISQLIWSESNNGVTTLNLMRGPEAKLTEQVAGLLKEKPAKIAEKQAIAAALQSARSLGFEVDVDEEVIGPKLCYYNLTDVSMGRKSWHNKNRPDVDGTSAMYGMLVRFPLPPSFSTVDVLLDQQTGEVLYVATSH